MCPYYPDDDGEDVVRTRRKSRTVRASTRNTAREEAHRLPIAPLPKLSPVALARLACEYYNTVNPNKLHPADLETSRVEFLDRISFNYVRYNLSGVPKHVNALAGNELLGRDLQLIVLRRIARAAKEAYPWLAEIAAATVHEAEQALHRLRKKATSN